MKHPSEPLDHPRSSTRRRAPFSAIGFATACAALALSAGQAQAATTVAGNIDTSAAFSPTNQSTDGLTYYNAPDVGSFPSSSFVIGEFDYTLSPGGSVSAASISGNFGSDTLGSSTAEVDLFVDQVMVARCDATCAAASETADVAWSHTFSGAELAALASGRAVLTAIQQGPSQVVLDPTSISLDLAAPVPEPASAWLWLAGLPLLVRGLSRHRAPGGLSQ